MLFLFIFTSSPPPSVYEQLEARGFHPTGDIIQKINLPITFVFEDTHTDPEKLDQIFSASSPLITSNRHLKFYPRFRKKGFNEFYSEPKNSAFALLPKIEIRQNRYPTHIVFYRYALREFFRSRVFDYNKYKYCYPRNTYTQILCGLVLQIDWGKSLESIETDQQSVNLYVRYIGFNLFDSSSRQERIGAQDINYPRVIYSTAENHDFQTFDTNRRTEDVRPPLRVVRINDE